MRVTKSAMLLACLMAAAPARAQIPRDPLAGAAPSGKAAIADASRGREALAPYVTRQSEVEVPFTVRTGGSPETQPTAVRVFVSWDRGKTWHFYDELRPEAGRFRFRAKQDGEFWFATQTIDRSGRSDGAEPKSPQLRVLIDSQRPQLFVQAKVDATGNLNLAWSASDPSIVPTSLKVEYQDAAGASGNWETLELRSTATANKPTTQVSGQIAFRPVADSRVINLRAEIADAAGNIAYYTQRLLLEPSNNAAGSLARGPTPDPSATRWQPSGPPVERSTDNQTSASSAEQVRIPNPTTASLGGQGRLTSAASRSSSGSEELPVPEMSNRSAESNQPTLPPPAVNRPASSKEPSLSIAPPTGPIESPQYQPLPNGSDQPPSATSEIMPAPQRGESVETPTGQRPRLTNSRRFSLDYDIQSVGPEGLDAVELWGSTDAGRTWVKWGVDPDKASPFDVEVNHEATYGFRIVIVGRNGLATTTPGPGDAADIWVGIDLTRPQARLTGALYGQGDAAGKLDIRWEATDTNLGSRPVTLSIGDRPDGPFTPIAAGLPNSGQYYWEYDPRSPRQILLRLEVRDEAGNIAIDQLTEPIRVEGLEPKGRIRDFQPGPEELRGAFRSPLFR